MMYLLTPEHHKQIVEAFTFEIGGEPCGGQQALAVLKAMQPVEPCAWQHHFDDKSKRLSYCDDKAGFPPRAGAVEIKPLYTPTKD